MRLYDCEYREGRADSAPELRREERPRTEIKEAESSQGLNMCVLPHRLPEDRLNRDYPYISAAEELETYEAQMSPKDYLEEAGAKIAMQIEDDARRFGRLRTLADARSAGTPGKCMGGARA